jgi:hypothetical protein
MTGGGPVGSVDFNWAVAPLMQEQCNGARHQHRQTYNTST